MAKSIKKKSRNNMEASPNGYPQTQKALAVAAEKAVAAISMIPICIRQNISQGCLWKQSMLH